MPTLPAREKPEMSITVLSSNPKVKWPLMVKTLAQAIGRPEAGLLSVIDVGSSMADQRDIFLVNPNFLLVGKAALEFFMRRLPQGYRVKELDYGQTVPALYVIDSISGFSKFFLALYFPEPASLDGRNLYNGCLFLCANLAIRDRLFMHQIRRYFAPHEGSIFGVDPRTLPAPSHGHRSETLRTLARNAAEGVAGVQRPPTEDDLPF